MPYEPGKRDVRASDADREATVERLRVAGMEGRLDNDELEERIESAYAARWCGELETLTLDITPPPARLHPMAPVFVRPSRRPNGLAIASVVVGVLWMGWLGLGRGGGHGPHRAAPDRPLRRDADRPRRGVRGPGSRLLRPLSVLLAIIVFFAA